MLKNKPVIGIIPTYNLENPLNDPYMDRASFVRMYEEKIVASGGIPIGLLHQNIEMYLELCDGYLWPGGSKVWPDFYPVIEDAIKNKKPLLGVCLGLQSLGLYFNFREEYQRNPQLSYDEIKQILKDNDHYLKKLEDSSLHNHYVTKEKESQEAARHRIYLQKNTLFYKIMKKEKLDVVSLHTVILPYVAYDVLVSARSEDGVIEAIEYTKDGAQILGVQFHPELEKNGELFEWLIDASYQKTLLLINKQNKIPNNYSLKIVAYRSSYPGCQNDGSIALPALDSWLELKKAMHKKGFFIDVESAYRSNEIQRKIYEENIEKYGQDHADIFVAKPGYSEHETGLAIDICMRKEDKWFNEFDEELNEVYPILHEICAQYGFILRYPEGKEKITGYHYEPWHLRYIGSPRIAKYIMENHLTLEEFYEKTLR